ncbi:MAG: hypothetical protein ACYTAF_12985 [Planctomycetota bacterium]|jgi:histone H3/H4
MAEILIVQSKVKALAKKKGFRFSGEAVSSLSNAVKEVIEKAGKRAKANRRQTIKGTDI